MSASERPEHDPHWDEHYRDERDAAFLYRALSEIERNPERRQLFEKLSVVEDRHAERWEQLFEESGHPLPSARAPPRLLA
jgi:rubrerythrin